MSASWGGGWILGLHEQRDWQSISGSSTPSNPSLSTHILTAMQFPQTTLHNRHVELAVKFVALMVYQYVTFSQKLG